ncbi:Exonuclease SbcC [Actinacidiphila bryophytorum]|uniref:Exonuclease SbcC n=1 Tax=Actinacidiphila bryophytorum TaxID=1436133 RepID=A0A9W4E6G4_9ACTN|nr:Exonuclease SbcC [Actinacidiphila bryophytorum]
MPALPHDRPGPGGDRGGGGAPAAYRPARRGLQPRHPGRLRRDVDADAAALPGRRAGQGDGGRPPQAPAAAGAVRGGVSRGVRRRTEGA